MKMFPHFYNFLRTHSRVQNLSLVEHDSWYSGEMKLRYNLKTSNVTEIVTQWKVLFKSKYSRPTSRIFAGAGLFKNTAVRYVEPAVNRQPGFRRELVE